MQALSSPIDVALASCFGNPMADAVFREIVEALPFPVALVGPDQRLRAANAPAIALFGINAVGQHFVVSVRNPAILTGVERVLGRGEGSEATMRKLEGPREMLWRAVMRPVTTSEGRGALLSFEDITVMEETGQMRRDFVANVSHELRTPLTAFRGFVETLRGAARRDPKAQDRFLEIMEREAERMSRLIDDLLSLSRVEQEVRVQPREQADLVAVTEQAVALLSGGLGEGRIVLNAPVEALVQGDIRQLQQVVTNLIENALKYGGDGGTVRVDIAGPGRDAVLQRMVWRLSVSDEGEGIEEHHIPRLTERFYRVDSHRSREMGGTGLGLAIVKHIVTRHRGRLRIESEPGKGSVFSVFLPVSASGEGA
jgi:two-component system phosphate regulon sensor histidine kinase PhoR